MSYILEALKKAQAERQLGSSPTIHAPTLQSAERAVDGGRFKAPVVLALLGMAAVIGVLLTLVLRTSEPAAPAVAPLPPQGALAAAPSVAAVMAAPAPQSAAVAAPAPAPLREPTPLPAPVADLPPSVAQLAKASAPAPSPASAAAASAAAAPVAVAAKPAAAPDEPVMNLRDLPEPIQRSIPQVAVGGYIYSKNPADRVLLIDKVLRREGEEVAPGLTLEKLQPKEAVFSFKGYRYRVPY
ncbi:general secretion pathway protein GspB [Duganella sp. CT11-25]|jgi:general secretion pathway protein B|uniref:general secretion pathway protein GspB n=1 Tax=unclassified Duganella TaxID=2636909 RepID=UPI0039B0AF1B